MDAIVNGIFDGIGFIFTSFWYIITKIAVALWSFLQIALIYLGIGIGVIVGIWLLIYVISFIIECCKKVCQHISRKMEDNVTLPTTILIPPMEANTYNTYNTYNRCHIQNGPSPKIFIISREPTVKATQPTSSRSNIQATQQPLQINKPSTSVPENPQPTAAKGKNRSNRNRQRNYSQKNNQQEVGKPKAAQQAPRINANETPPQTDAASECVICMDSRSIYSMVPCGHVCLCENCVTSFRSSNLRQHCPVCRNDVERVMRVYN